MICDQAESFVGINQSQGDVNRGSPLVDREVFEGLIEEVRRPDGARYEDLDKIYGDLSRLLVAWLASMEPEEIRERYAVLGWKGEATAQAIREAAR